MNVRDRLRQVKEKSKAWKDPVRSALDWTPDDHDMVYYGPLANWDPSLEEHSWDNHGGKVTLAGDAAHPMTYRTFPRFPFRSRQILTVLQIEAKDLTMLWMMQGMSLDFSQIRAIAHLLMLLASMRRR